MLNGHDNLLKLTGTMGMRSSFEGSSYLVTVKHSFAKVTSLENLVVFVGDLWISLRPRRFLRTKLLILSWHSTLKLNTHTLSLRRLRSPLNFLYSLAYICHHFTSEYLKLNQTILPVVYDFLLTTFPLNNLMIFCKRRSSVASRSSNRGCVAVFLLSREEKIRV